MCISAQKSHRTGWMAGKEMGSSYLALLPARMQPNVLLLLLLLLLLLQFNMSGY
jgi:hypothetical protein